MNDPRADKPERELTIRALCTGMTLGALLAPCNVYSGLKIGWSFNMSITALLLAYAFWVPLCRRFGWAAWGLKESNINQTAASSAASIISGGLVAPLPALALLSGENLPWQTLIAWVFAVSFLGVWVGWYLRERMIVRSNLAFPAGVATAETLRDIFSKGEEAVSRVRMLLSALSAAAVFNFVDDVMWRIPRFAPTDTASKLTLSFDPSLLMFGFGSIIGLRAGLGLLLGALVAWGLMAPSLMTAGIVVVDGDQGSWFQPLVTWLLWPGVAMMTCSSLMSFLLGVRGDLWRKESSAQPAAEQRHKLLGLGIASGGVVVLQVVVFDIDVLMAFIAIPLAFLLATVAARVAGETGIPPIGAIGKVSQLSFGVLAPQQMVTNLMTANVAGGAAGQGADLLNDLKAGHLVGATPGYQIVAQCCGVLIGSIAGSLVYLSLIRNPEEQLLSAEWPAPAVATWKAVAETLSQGLSGIPDTAVIAMLVGGVLGIGLSLLERRVTDKYLTFVPSGATVGLAFVIPASTSLTLFLGALFAAVVHRYAKHWAQRLLLSLAAGLVAGESLYGVIAVWF